MKFQVKCEFLYHHLHLFSWHLIPQLIQKDSKNGLSPENIEVHRVNFFLVRCNNSMSAPSTRILLSGDSVKINKIQKYVKKRNKRLGILLNFAAMGWDSKKTSVGLLCFVNLINYMDRYTVSGKLLSMAPSYYDIPL